MYRFSDIVRSNCSWSLWRRNLGREQDEAWRDKDAKTTSQKRIREEVVFSALAMVKETKSRNSSRYFFDYS